MNNEAQCDARARQLHASGLTHVPLAIRTRLHPRSVPARGAFTWPLPLALGAAALAVAVIGTQRLRVATPDQPTIAVARANADLARTPAPAMPAYDNDPDFYAWLGTTEGVPGLEDTPR